MKKKIAVIGSGFSGLAAAASLGKQGHEVHVFEKNKDIGGRARQFTAQGFTFDMGPSWYWMPDVFERFFKQFNHKPSDFYELKKLDPGFRVVFDQDKVIDIPESYEALCDLFESLEKGSADRLNKFMREAEFKYEVGVNDLVYQPGLSVSELIRKDLISGLLRLQVFNSFSTHVRKYFKDPRIIAIMEFPVLFLGAKPEKTPALYSLMNYAGLKQGTYYPMGGFGKVIEGMQQVALEYNVHFHFNEVVHKLETRDKKVAHISANGHSMDVAGVIGAVDYHHLEKELLEKPYRNYSESYWDRKTFAPSSLIFYLGVNKKIEAFRHHNLFFDEDLGQHAVEIYDTKVWPSKPLFYVCAPSITDPSVAPEGKENLFILMPIAPGLEDNDSIRSHYFELIMSRLKKYLGFDLKEHLIYEKSYCVSDFINDYNSYKGNAYGLANTLSQTANLKPKIKNKHLSNLYYAGQLTVPGPGVPPSIISGQVAANLLNQHLTS